MLLGRDLHRAILIRLEGAPAESGRPPSGQLCPGEPHQGRHGQGTGTTYVTVIHCVTTTVCEEIKLMAVVHCVTLSRSAMHSKPHVSN